MAQGISRGGFVSRRQRLSYAVHGAGERPIALLPGLLLTDPPDGVRTKIARATTDTNPEVREPLGAGVANLVDIYAPLRGLTHEEALAQRAAQLAERTRARVKFAVGLR